MSRAILLCLAFGSACATASPISQPKPTTPPSWRARVKLQGAVWRIAYEFPQAQRALIFDSSHGDYRTTRWIASSTTTSIERHAGLDALVFAAPTTHAELELRPSARAPEGALAIVPFSDGSHALWLGQLAVLTAQSREAIAGLDGDLRAWRGEQPPIEVTIDADRPLIGPRGVGQHFEAQAYRGRGAYVYTGASADPMMIVDPGLPAIVKSTFTARMPEVQARLRERWSQPIASPQLMLAWGGGDGDWLNRGRAEGGQIVMRIQGARYLDGDPALLGDLVWFFAHELTHLHQFADGGAGETWMIEGLADSGATDILVRIGLWDKATLERRYWSVSRECARELSRGPLARGGGRAAYVCGDLVGVALMAALPDHSLPVLWKTARAGDGRRVTDARLFAAARALGASEAAVAAIEAFVSTQHADTDAAIRALLEAAGAQPVYADGSLSSMEFPFGR